MFKNLLKFFKREQTSRGLIIAEQLTPASFKIVEDSVEQFYKKLRDINQQAINKKLKASEMYIQYIRENTAFIPKENCHTIKVSTSTELESHSGNEVTISFNVYFEGKVKHYVYSVYSICHNESDRTLSCIVEDIRRLKKLFNSDKTVGPDEL